MFHRKCPGVFFFLCCAPRWNCLFFFLFCSYFPTAVSRFNRSYNIKIIHTITDTKENYTDNRLIDKINEKAILKKKHKRQDSYIASLGVERSL